MRRQAFNTHYVYVGNLARNNPVFLKSKTNHLWEIIILYGHATTQTEKSQRWRGWKSVINLRDLTRAIGCHYSLDWITGLTFYSLFTYKMAQINANWALCVCLCIDGLFLQVSSLQWFGLGLVTVQCTNNLFWQPFLNNTAICYSSAIGPYKRHVI